MYLYTSAHVPAHMLLFTPPSMEEQEDNRFPKRGMFLPSHSRTVQDIVWFVLIVWLQILIQNPGTPLHGGLPGVDCGGSHSEDMLVGQCKGIRPGCLPL